jgi:hypothetical protein
MQTIIFNGLNLNDGINYIVEKNPHETVAKQEVNVQKIARTNDSVLLRKGYGIRSFSVDVVIIDSSEVLLDARLDTFKYKMEASGKNLDIDYASGTRRYVCTGNVDGEIVRKGKWATAKVRFDCYTAFGEDSVATTQSFLAKTVTPYADTFVVGGSAKAQPDITITIHTFTGAGTKQIKLTNSDTGDYIQLDRSDWAANDVIAINSKLMIVTKNGVQIQYLGMMPEWEVGTINWQYSDTFSARNVDVAFSYKKKYL